MSTRRGPTFAALILALAAGGASAWGQPPGQREAADDQWGIVQPEEPEEEGEEEEKEPAPSASAQGVRPAPAVPKATAVWLATEVGITCGVVAFLLGTVGVAMVAWYCLCVVLATSLAGLERSWRKAFLVWLVATVSAVGVSLLLAEFGLSVTTRGQAALATVLGCVAQALAVQYFFSTNWGRSLLVVFTSASLATLGLAVALILVF